MRVTNIAMGVMIFICLGMFLYGRRNKKIISDQSNKDFDEAYAQELQSIALQTTVSEDNNPGK